jgi:hypothetical protein
MRQIGYWGVLASIFGLAAWLRLRVPIDPIADPDTWGYLSPALRKLTGAEFGHTHGRNFVYPGFLFLLLRVFGDFRAISIAQHFSGLIAGAMLLLTWRRARIFASELRVGHGIHNAVGLLATAMFLWSTEPIHLEMQIRPEGVCAFLLSTNFYFVLQFAICCFIEHRRLSAAVYGTSAVFTSFVLGSVRPSFWFVAIDALLPIMIFFFRPGWLRQKVAIGVSAAVIAVMLFLPEYFLSRQDEISRTFLPTTLFVVHADLIRDQIARDLADNVQLPYPSKWLQQVHEILSKAIAQSHAANANTRRYALLGFDPDDLRSKPSSVTEQLRRDFKSDASALCAFYRFYYWRIWKQQPGLVLKKIARQMGVFYASRCPAYRLTKWLPLNSEYERGVQSLEWPAYQRVWATYQPAADFMDRTRLLTRNPSVVEQSTHVRWPLTVLANTYRPLLLVALAMSALVLGQKQYRHSLGWMAALVLFAYSYNFASCFEVAIVQSLEVGRFVTVQVYCTVLAQFLSIWFILEFLLEGRALIGCKPANQLFGDPEKN